MTDYNKQGEDFLTKTETTFKVVFKRQGKYFDGDKDERDIYDITLTRGGRSYTFCFGQSTQCSGRYCAYDNPLRGISPGKYFNEKWNKPLDDYPMQKKWGVNKDFKVPSAYDVLASITKYDPGTFENFCGDFGYDTDSRKAEVTYKQVIAEYTHLCTLYSDAELELMLEIQ